MLFTVLKNKKINHPLLEVYPQLLGHNFQCQSSNNVFCTFEFNDVKGIYINHSNYGYFFLNTFTGQKILEFQEYFSLKTNEKIDRIHFNISPFKPLHGEKKYKIIEIEIITSDPLCDEILISGADLENSEDFKTLVQKGQIKKMVTYFQSFTPNEEGFILKIFYDGKISIIPDFDFNYLNDFFMYFLEMVSSE